MKVKHAVPSFLCCLALPLFAAERTGTLKTTYLGYDASDGLNDKTYPIAYVLPDPRVFGPGPYPVFMWTSGTFEPHVDPQALLFMNQMASRGFLAASVQYNNMEPVQACKQYTDRARSVFDSTTPTSAIGVLCALGSANCGKGVVTAGISQGGMLAVLARNYAPQVAATYAMSVSDYNLIGHLRLPCMDKANTLIPADRLTIVNGISDEFFAGQSPLQNVSGIACADGTLQCWSPNGSGGGWYIVQNSQLQDGLADHCYPMNGGCIAITQDPNWQPASSYNWSLTPNLDWLASFGTKRNFSPTNQ